MDDDVMADPAGANDFSRWRRTSPLAVIFFIGQTLERIRAIGNLLIGLGLAFLIVRAREFAGQFIPAAILFIVIVAALRYWFFRFRITRERILIRHGVFRKTALDLPLDRIQAVNVERSLAQRLLGLATIFVDTAGSGAVEAVIPWVKAASADRIRARVAAARKRPVGEGEVDGAAEARAGREGEVDVAAERLAGPLGDPGTAGKQREDGLAGHLSGDEEPRGEVVMKLPPGDMVRIGLRSTAQAGMLAPLLAFLTRDPRDLLRYAAGQLGFIEPIGRDQVPEDYVTSVADALFRTGAMLVLLALVAAIGIYYAFKIHYGFTLYRIGAVHRIRAGLFTQREVVVQSVKVQQVTLYQNLVDRCFRRFRLRAEPVSDEAELEIPLLGARMAEALRTELFGREGRGLTLLPQNRAIARVSPHFIGATTLKMAAPPALGLAAFVLLIAGAPDAIWAEISFVLALVCLVVGGLVALQRWRRLGYLHDDDGISVRTGFVARQVDAFLFRKAQSVTVKQSPMQRRKGLATLEIELAGEVVAIPYIDHRVACRLRDYILYKVESNPRWH